MGVQALENCVQKELCLWNRFEGEVLARLARVHLMSLLVTAARVIEHATARTAACVTQHALLE